MPTVPPWRENLDSYLLRITSNTFHHCVGIFFLIHAPFCSVKIVLRQISDTNVKILS